MLEYNVNPNDSVFLRLQLARTDTGLYPQAKIYAIDDPTTVVDTVNLVEYPNGLYGAEWINDGIRKKYFTQTIVYTGSYGGTIHPLIRPDSDSINVGFNTTGGVVSVGGMGTHRSVKVERLTSKEIDQIVKNLYTLIKPDLELLAKPHDDTQLIDTLSLIATALTDMVDNLKQSEQSIVASISTNLTSTLSSLQQELAKNISNIKLDTELATEAIVGQISPIVEEHSLKYENLIARLTDKIEKEGRKPDEGRGDKLLTGHNLFLFAVKLGYGIRDLYTIFSELSPKDKEKVFASLALREPRLLKRLSEYSRLHHAKK